MEVTILFYVFAIIILAAAFKMVFSRNLVHSALYMVLTFIGVACIYVLLHADFLAIIQILVYVGAISVLMVFGVMLTRRDSINESNLFNNYEAAAFWVVLSLFVVIVCLIVTTVWNKVSEVAQQSTIDQIADLLMKENVIAFEVAGILLLAAMVGAIIIGKGVDDSK